MDIVLYPQILLVGDSGVGKSSLSLRFCDDGRNPPKALTSTIGIDSNTRTIEIDGKLIRLHIWDSSGQEQYRAVNKLGWRGAMGVLLVYDVTDEISFNNIRSWSSDVEKYVQKGVNKILVGNKSDWTDKRAVTEEQARKLANELGINLFMETSAKVNEGVEEVFFRLARGSLPVSVSLNQPAAQAQTRCCS
ncbi:hypothetical protein M413DRAFT_449901 [Hebeloma cylindrosporum]|uniref:Uncharacterized protein n=1 Tax=Hebeloma cylindrosporum TaxID=76867 RepID=A0A0C3BSN6_HEBCY|nr:hypothetical protein M413DRAFT_449901 [Hebeloma cylindrosporum h7]